MNFLTAFRRFASGITLMLSLVVILPGTVWPQTDLRRNVQIEVQMKSAGFTRENEWQNLQHQSNATQTLLVTDGLEGRLFIGSQVPYANWYWNYLKNEGYLTGEITFHNVGTSVVVTPRIMGDTIEVSLTPEISYETNDGRGTIAVKKLSTTVVVPNGQSVEIGAGAQKTEFENNFYRRETGEAVRIILTPRIQES